MSAEAVSEVVQSVADLADAVNRLVAENEARRQQIGYLTHSVDQHDRRASAPGYTNQSMAT